MTITVGKLRKALEGLSDDMPVFRESKHQNLKRISSNLEEVELFFHDDDDQNDFPRRYSGEVRDEKKVTCLIIS